MEQSVTAATAKGNAGIELPPVSSMLMQSLRSVGYSTATALADIVDNSIAAGAINIRIFFTTTPLPRVIILDDGNGMDDETLISAMRFGSRDPREPRYGVDLGRFGLGLKTASLSQCRRFSVASIKAGTAIARWDLEACDRLGTWWLDRPDRGELPG